MYLLGLYLATCLISIGMFIYNIIIDFNNINKTKFHVTIITILIVSCIPVINLCYIIPAMINGGKIDINKMIE
jgi:cytochrome bd-type quinol oxidase subunit 2